MRSTLVSFHAHPDDEALLTGGTLAAAAAAGHRVVLVVATLGEAGLAAEEVRAAGSLGARRRNELAAAAAALGCDRVEWLGYDDSGMDAEHAGPGTTAFSTADVDRAAARLAALLDEEDADVLTVYDPSGGYGHPDHVQVYTVGLAAAARARRAPRVLAATIDRRVLVRAARMISWLPGMPDSFAPGRFRTAYSAPETITHVIDVRAHTGAKRAAMAAHASQAGGGADLRTLALFLRFPRPLYSRVFAREWFVEQGCVPGPVPVGDVFRAAPRAAERA